MILDHHGYRVLYALDGSSGVRLAQEAQPSLIVTELFLPRVDGSTVTDRLRSDPSTAEIPLSVLDSIPAVGTQLMSRLPGATRLTKPCEPSRLLQEVERMLSAAACSPS